MSEETIAKQKKTTKVRYYNANKVKDEDLQSIKLKKKNKQKLVEDFVKVEDKPPPPQLKKLKTEKYATKVKFNKGKLLKAQQIKQKKKNVPSENKPKLPKHMLAKYSRGEAVQPKGVKTKHFKEKFVRKENLLDFAVEQAARAELLLQEDEGFLLADEHEITANYRQSEIAANVDIQAAAKHFKLKLDFGPYNLRYTKNGRDLVIGGKRGHIAAFDWITKRLRCEMNVMEEVADVCWLHVNTMFACAQKDWVRIYDTQGTELHCIKRMYRINRLEFLPYHFLLASCNSEGYASWLDVSIGEMVANFNTRLGDIRLMRHNPGNGVLCIGGGKGVVSMWSPKVREPLATVLCHRTPMTALTIDTKGQHLVTAGLDKKIKVFDLRKLGEPVRSYTLNLPANQVEVSQRGVLAFSQGVNLETYSNLLMGKDNGRVYLRHRADNYIHGMRFCPYEDVLGIATANGFESLLVPGAGEPNYDALEDNPYQTKKQRREHEVHSLLEKIPADLITLNPNDIAGVDVPSLQERVDAKRALFHVKPPKIDFKSRHKMKGKGGSVKAAKNKQIVKDLKRKEFIQDIRKAKQEVINAHKVVENNTIKQKTKKTSTVLDRFKAKNKPKIV